MSDWEQTTLGEVARITIGKTPPRKRPEYWTEDLTHPFCTIADMDGRCVDPRREGVTQSAIDEGKAKLFPAGSLMMSFKLSIGRIGFAARDLYPNEAIARLESLSDDLDERFLAIALEAQDLTVGSGRAVKGKTLNRGSMRAIPVRVPSLMDQRRIVDLIAAVDAQMEALRGELETGRAAQEPLVGSLLGDGGNDWPIKSLSDVGEFIRGRRFTKADYVESDFGCIHYGQIHTDLGLITFEPLTYLPELFRERMRLASPGDVVIAGTSENTEDLGNATVWLGNDDVAVHDDAYIFKHQLEPVFASCLFVSPEFQGQKVQYATSTKVTRISGDNLGKIKVPIPPKDVQARIGDAVRALDEGLRNLESELATLRAFRAALLTSLLNQEIEIPESYDALLEEGS